MLEDAETDILAFDAFPPDHWRKLRSTNPLSPLERQLRPLAHADERVPLLMGIPGVAELLGLTIAAEIVDVARFPNAR
jgi:transposase